ncbi:meiosis expressed gene 1 protein homolog [Anneissia japonica]|uniref:meiosis expressed gene 1 protein homolog n=1 Tax=Anneissia japonica TaxID=1529436 RepID=UPI0014254C59|nr:meiosis expressed gene 1 protein homolog [Anneissia japonica]XP_033104416.1 meiosis expressed gene 1 protein homolog [Anneissia japonica]
MSASVDAPQPKSIRRPKTWSDEVEEAYRFQLAGYRDETEYLSTQREITRWPHNGYIKKLTRKDGYFYYYNKTRECEEKDVHKTKLYEY